MSISEAQVSALLTKLAQRSKAKITVDGTGLTILTQQTEVRIPIQPQVGRKTSTRFR